MAHFAQIDNNGIVLRVLVIPDHQEHRGSDYLRYDLNLGANTQWVQTSYNTIGGVHTNGGFPLRKNYAGIGYKYDLNRDAFIPPKPYSSWVLNENTCLWEPPIPRPSNIENYYWSEESLNWVKVEN